jgi:hypothetical protein
VAVLVSDVVDVTATSRVFDVDRPTASGRVRRSIRDE